MYGNVADGMEESLWGGRVATGVCAVKSRIKGKAEKTHSETQEKLYWQKRKDKSTCHEKEQCRNGLMKKDCYSSCSKIRLNIKISVQREWVGMGRKR